MGRYENATMSRETETMCKATKTKAWFLVQKPGADFHVLNCTTLGCANQAEVGGEASSR